MYKHLDLVVIKWTTHSCVDTLVFIIIYDSLFLFPSNVQNILSNPNLMQQIHQMSQTIQKTEQMKNEMGMQEEMRQRVLQQQQAEFDQQIGQVFF